MKYKNSKISVHIIMLEKANARPPVVFFFLEEKEKQEVGFSIWDSCPSTRCEIQFIKTNKRFETSNL